MLITFLLKKAVLAIKKWVLGVFLRVFRAKSKKKVGYKNVDNFAGKIKKKKRKKKKQKKRNIKKKHTLQHCLPLKQKINK